MSKTHLIRDRIDHPEFRSRSLIDQGGMGAILEAAEERTGRPVALKVMHPETMRSADALERFYLEARVLARLEHPNIVPLHVLKTDREGRPFYTMKKIAGRTLQAILSGLRKGDPEIIVEFPLHRLIRIFDGVCDAMAFAHANGVIHRDLKPANIMVGEFGEVLVMDWGLVKVLDEPESERPAETVNIDSPPRNDEREAGAATISAGPGALTREGAVMGTPQYMAPEQARGLIADIDQRSDVFALGGLLYAILTLHPPFHGEDVREILTKVCRGEVIDPALFTEPEKLAGRFPKTRSDFELVHCPGGRLPTALVSVALKAMSVPMVERYPTVGNLQLDIEAWLDGRTTSAEEPSLLRSLTLAVRRHRVLCLAAVLVFGLAVAFTVNVRKSRARAVAALQELRAAVPMFEDEGRALTASHRFAEAVKRYKECLALMPERAAFHVALGNLHQSLLDFSASIAAYERALRLKPNLTAAAEGLALSRRLEKVAGGDRARYLGGLADLRRLMERQQRFAEAEALGKRMAELREDVSAEIENWRERIRRAGAGKGVAMRLRNVGGRLTLDLTGLRVDSLDFLKGIPIRDLDLSGLNLESLAPIKSLPLERLVITDTRVANLSDLAGMKLRELRAGGTRVANLSPLSKMPLQVLDLSGTSVADLAPLRGRPLVEVNLTDCRRVRDIRPVVSPRLKRLYAGGIGSLEPGALAGLKLVELDVRDAGLKDLGFLKGMPLRELVLDGNPVTNLKPLASLDLRVLSLNGLNVANLLPLREMPLERLSLLATKVHDLRPLATLPLRELDLRGCPVTDVTALRGLPLRRIDLTGCTHLRDVTALADCLELEYIALPYPPQHKLNLNSVRSLPHLRKITASFNQYRYDWSRVPSPDNPTNGFWKFYDAKWAPAFRGK